MIEINNKTRSKINMSLVRATAGNFLKYYKIKNKNLSIAFIGDKVMARLNQQYRKHKRPTDILSFAGNGADLGEIIIDYVQIKRQAKKYSKTINQELIFILTHGLLHLLGYDDETEKDRQKMIALSEEFIAWQKKL